MISILHFTATIGTILAVFLLMAAIGVSLFVKSRSAADSTDISALDALMLGPADGLITRGAAQQRVSYRPPVESVAQLIEIRLTEAKGMVDRYENLARLSSWANGLLTTGHYVVGGVLATSFAQQQLPGPVAGGLGLVVLVSSVAEQRFRPERAATRAKRIATQVRKLARETEDLLSVAENSSNEGALFEAVQRLSRGLSDIELSELEVIPARSTRSRSFPKPKP